MNVKEMRVTWNIGWANLPHLNMLLDEPPPWAEVWRVFPLQGGTYFVSRQEPVVRFVFEAERGGGALGQRLTLESGAEYVTNGGWSSSETQINRLRAIDERFAEYLPHDVVGITYHGEYARPDSYNDGWGLGLAGCCFDLPWVEQQIAQHLEGIELYDLTDRSDDGGNEHQADATQSLIVGGSQGGPYIPVPTGARTKDEIKPDYDTELFRRTCMQWERQAARKTLEKRGASHGTPA